MFVSRVAQMPQVYREVALYSEHGLLIGDRVARRLAMMWWPAEDSLAGLAMGQSFDPVAVNVSGLEWRDVDADQLAAMKAWLGAAQRREQNRRVVAVVA